ncbi:MAG: tail protein X [Pseudomonadota bacterium]
MATYVTSALDTADLICWRVFGQTGALTEALLELNPGLAAQGPQLPAGLTLELPDAPEDQARAPLRLWD